MNSTISTIVLICLLSSKSFSQVPQVAHGQLIRWADFSSQYVKPRHIDIWLPPGYDSTKRYPVLYMHDGQMLFDSTTTWNKKEWGVDEVLGKLMNENQISPCIVVGVWNSGPGRFADYFPEKPWFSVNENWRKALMEEPQARAFPQGKPVSDNYLKFLVTELKPEIDERFATLKNQKNTWIAGSSMGGLISWYALCEYPKVFSRAICMSTHWTAIYRIENNLFPEAFIHYLKNKLPKPGKHKLYFDYGTATLDSMYKPFQEKVDLIMKKKGYNQQNWITLEFPGEAHSEKAWNKRFDKPMLFLEGKAN
jgi:predicted alpha/beta superfamily hydrolase